MQSRRTAQDQMLRMERAYVDAESGKTICCWEASERQQIVDLFHRANVIIESVTPVAEVLAEDFA